MFHKQSSSINFHEIVFSAEFQSTKLSFSIFFVSPKMRLEHYNRNRKLQTSKAPLKSQAQGTSLITSAASNQRGFPKNSPWEAQVRFPEGERMRQIRGVFQRIVRGKLRSGCQKVRGGRLGVKAGVV